MHVFSLLLTNQAAKERLLLSLVLHLSLCPFLKDWHINRVLIKCGDVIKIKFLKIWDLLEYFERTTSEL